MVSTMPPRLVPQAIQLPLAAYRRESVLTSAWKSLGTRLHADVRSYENLLLCPQFSINYSIDINYILE